VQRIKDVRALRARQFPEDAGPLAHPVRPSSYLKIENFYTATIYEKGAEVIRMLKTLIGADAFAAGMDLYFTRWDGCATTVEAFIACFAEASGRDLTAFFGWYEQAGTPAVSMEADYDPDARALTLTLTQSTAPTPGQPDKRPLPTPIAIGLLDEDGGVQTFRAPDADALTDSALVVLDEARRTIRLEGVERRPVLSPLRGFSAPVVLTTNTRPVDRYVLLANDADLFNRWEAGQDLSRDLMLARASGAPDEVGEERYAEAIGRGLDDQRAEPAFKALMLTLPSESDLATASAPADPAALHEARDALRARLAIHLGERLRDLHGGLQEMGEFSPDSASAGRRALRNAALELLAADPHADNLERIRGHFEAAGNMTDAVGGLTALMLVGGEAFDQALAAFYARWRDEPLVIDKWFAIQARSPSEEAFGRVLGLTAHPAFDTRNPNRFRALVQTFASANPVRFHDPSGAGYRFLADQILAVDSFNPMSAARMVEPLGGWRRYRPELADQMRVELQRIVAAPGLSKNVLELASRSLA
jgi:aminopeptidase N